MRLLSNHLAKGCESEHVRLTGVKRIIPLRFCSLGNAKAWLTGPIEFRRRSQIRGVISL